MTDTIGGRLLLENGLVPGAIVVENGRIARIRADSTQARGPIVAPGFIDLQINGAFGCDCAQPGAVAELARRLPQTGVTAFLPTVISSTPDLYERLPDEIEAARATSGAQPLGLHAEGPLLSPARAGAHPRKPIEAADLESLLPLLDRDALRMVTLAPERPQATAWIRRLRGQGVTVSLGHTDATYEVVRAAVDAGATLVTHLYNAMSPFHHRAPGVVGAALDDDRIMVSVIADGVHCHPAALRLALRAKGAGGLVLVTDAVAAAGMGPGRYQLGAQEVIVDDSGARLCDGTLAGSTLTMDRAVREFVRMTAAPITGVLRMASEVPATILGLQNKGRIAVGCDADLVLLDDALTVCATVIAGRVVFRRRA